MLGLKLNRVGKRGFRPSPQINSIEYLIKAFDINFQSVNLICFYDSLPEKDPQNKCVTPKNCQLKMYQNIQLWPCWTVVAGSNWELGWNKVQVFTGTKVLHQLCFWTNNPDTDTNCVYQFSHLNDRSSFMIIHAQCQSMQQMLGDLIVLSFGGLFLISDDGKNNYPTPTYFGFYPTHRGVNLGKMYATK